MFVQINDNQILQTNMIFLLHHLSSYYWLTNLGLLQSNVDKHKRFCQFWLPNRPFCVHVNREWPGTSKGLLSLELVITSSNGGELYTKWVTLYFIWITHTFVSLEDTKMRGECWNWNTPIIRLPWMQKGNKIKQKASFFEKKPFKSCITDRHIEALTLRTTYEISVNPSNHNS